MENGSLDFETSMKKLQGILNLAVVNSLGSLFSAPIPTSFPGSVILGKKDPGSGWSRASQKVGGDKNNAGGRGKQVAILSFLNSLWKGQICLKM